MVPRYVRRAAGPPGSGHRHAAARGGAAPRPRVPARDAVGVDGPQGGAPILPGRLRLHPQLFLAGTVDRSAIPLDGKVREGPRRRLELMDSLDRRTRGAAHGPDHELMVSPAAARLGHDTGSGYAYLDQAASSALLAATNRRTATRLLWTALADVPGRSPSPTSRRANQWAVDVGLAARLDLHQDGYLGAARDEAARAVRSSRRPALISRPGIGSKA